MVEAKAAKLDKPKKSMPSFFNFIKKFVRWISLGIYTTFDYLLFTTLNIFLYAGKGLKYIFVEVPQNIYLAASGGVDTAYKQTKSVVKETVEATKESQSKLSKFFEDKYKSMGFVQKKEERLEQLKLNLSQELQSEEARRVEEATVYKYIAKKDGKFVTSYFTGFSKLDVNAYLLNEGYEVYHIETNKMINFLYGNNSIIANKMSNKDLIFWLTQLSTYVKSGIPLTDAVRILANQMGKSPARKRLYESIVYELTMGESFSKALEKQGAVFPSLLINMLKAAEATGELEETLDDMVEYYDETEKTRKQMLSAMTYPAIITVFALGVITFILLYVIPQFMDIYVSIGAEINGLTKTIINMSLFLQANIGYILIIIVIAIIAMTVCYKRIKAFRVVMQKFAMRIPAIGNIIIYKELTIFTKTFASLLKNNVYITESIDILSKITNNEIYKSIMFATITNLAKGEKISVAFKDHWAIPEVAYHMIVTGESTGELATMMTRVSSYFQDMNRNAVNALKSFIEPIMITSLALIVGVIILAVIIPMFDLYNSIEM